MPSKRSLRFSVLEKMYQAYKLNAINKEAVAQNITLLNTGIRESELDTFFGQYPQIDREDFIALMREVGGIRGKRRSASAGDGTRRTSLNTPEAARERGVSEEAIPEYISTLDELYTLMKKLNGLMTKARCAFAIPVRSGNSQ